MSTLDPDNIGTATRTPADIRERLEELRMVLRAENISYGELAELQSLADYIEDGDVELLEPAGVPEFGPGSRDDPGSRANLARRFAREGEFRQLQNYIDAAGRIIREVLSEIDGR